MDLELTSRARFSGMVPSLPLIPVQEGSAPQSNAWRLSTRFKLLHAKQVAPVVQVRVELGASWGNGTCHAAPACVHGSLDACTMLVFAHAMLDFCILDALSAHRRSCSAQSIGLIARSGTSHEAKCHPQRPCTQPCYAWCVPSLCCMRPHVSLAAAVRSLTQGSPTLSSAHARGAVPRACFLSARNPTACTCHTAAYCTQHCGGQAVCLLQFCSTSHGASLHHNGALIYHTVILQLPARSRSGLMPWMRTDHAHWSMRSWLLRSRCERGNNYHESDQDAITFSRRNAWSVHGMAQGWGPRLACLLGSNLSGVCWPSPAAVQSLWSGQHRVPAACCCCCFG